MHRQWRLAVPIPFREVGNDDRLGVAAYLRVVEGEDQELRAGLFAVTSRAEPVEFTFNRIEIPAHFLWRPGDAREAAVRSLCRSLFEATTKTPALLLVRAEEVPPRVFGEDFLVSVPLCRVAYGSAVEVATETSEDLIGGIQLYWVTDPPSADSPARELITALQQRDLLLEPFERAASGISEAFTQA